MELDLEHVVSGGAARKRIAPGAAWFKRDRRGLHLRAAEGRLHGRSVHWILHLLRVLTVRKVQKMQDLWTPDPSGKVQCAGVPSRRWRGGAWFEWPAGRQTCEPPEAAAAGVGHGRTPGTQHPPVEVRRLSGADAPSSLRVWPSSGDSRRRITSGSISKWIFWILKLLCPMDGRSRDKPSAAS